MWHTYNVSISTSLRSFGLVRSIKILNVPSQNSLQVVNASASTSCRVGNSSLEVDDADKGYAGGPKEKERLC